MPASQEIVTRLKNISIYVIHSENIYRWKNQNKMLQSMYLWKQIKQISCNIQVQNR